MAERFVIRCDMEGVSGVVDYAQVTPGAPEYALARDWFMAELLALIEGLQAGGASQIVIYDEHYLGRNIDMAQLPRGVTAICGKPPYRGDWAGGLDASAAGMILHGLHAKAGTPGALLPHTYELDIEDLSLNGTSLGEIGVESAIAGDWGVPVVLCVGDSAGCDEARSLLEIPTVATKFAQGESGAECRPLIDVVDDIRSAAEAAARQPTDMQPFRFDPPVELTIRFREGDYLAALHRCAPDRMIARDQLRIVAPTVTQAWADYWQVKLQGQSLAHQRPE